MSVEYKTCDICKDKTNCNFDLLLFGDWQQSRDITVHYFCLLLSTSLPQRGKDCSGINGFLVRDIRKEINEAAKRICCYCGRPHASIQCSKCSDYFHISCARQNRCLLTFHGDFRSYCDDCLPKTELTPAGLKSRPSSFERCSICREQMGLYNEVIFIFGKCCNKGYAHSVCVQKYALAAGYYLRCLWCRSKDFRDSVRLQGIFVPDRDARWEVQKDTYTDLHRGHSTCNMDVCRCPRGRDYNTGKWSLILCSLCGSVGAHNPKCLLGKENAKEKVTVFKCATCASTESAISGNRKQNEVLKENNNDIIDSSIFMTKKISEQKEKAASTFVATFSEDEGTQSSDSFVTVIPRKTLEPNSSAQNCVAKQLNREELNEINTAEKNIAFPVVFGTHAEDTVQQPTETLVLEINSSDEETSNVANEKLTTLPPINIDDEDTQVFENAFPNTSKTKGMADTSQFQKSLAFEDKDEETQLLDICSSDTHGIDAVTEVTSNQHTELKDIADSSGTITTQCFEHIQEIQTTSVPDNCNQSPVVSSSSQAEENEEWINFEVYEYDEVEGKCIGTATIRINIHEERFASKTLEEIEESSDRWLSDGDIIARSDDVGIFQHIDAIIAEYSK